MPRVDEIHVPTPAQMAVDPEGESAVEKPGSSGPAASRTRTLPAFDNYQRQSHYFDIYNRGQTPLTFSIKTQTPWLRVAPSEGIVEQQQRVWVTVDWQAVPIGVHEVPISIESTNHELLSVTAPVENHATPNRAGVIGIRRGERVCLHGG